MAIIPHIPRPVIPTVILTSTRLGECSESEYDDWYIHVGAHLDDYIYFSAMYDQAPFDEGGPERLLHCSEAQEIAFKSALEALWKDFKTQGSD